MTSTNDVRDDLMKMRDDQLLKLVALASDRKAAESILSRIRSLEVAISAVDPPTQPLEYARYKRATDAILACLDKAGVPLAEADLIQQLIDGGYSYGGDKIPWRLSQAIRSFTNGTGRATGQIKVIYGLIGRGEWDVSLFESGNH